MSVANRPPGRPGPKGTVTDLLAFYIKSGMGDHARKLAAGLDFLERCYEYTLEVEAPY
jgi:hypothetical protein